MTLDQLLTSLITLLTRAGSNRVSGADILTACQNIVSFFSSQIASIIPDWTDALTFNADGSGTGKYCKYPDSTGKKRLYESLSNGNINHAPPANGGSNSYWQEISASASASIPEWSAGVYGPSLIIVFHNHSTDGRGLYVLLEAVRPFNSTNIETEITAGKWERLGGDSGGVTFADLIGDADDNASLVSYVISQINSAVTGLWDDRGNFNASVNAYPSSGGSGTAGAILKGDVWTVSVAGTLPTAQAVSPGDTVRALVDTPGNTQSNWAINGAASGSTTPDASESTKGKAELADQAETNTGTDDARIVTPLKLKTKLANRSTKTGNYSIVSSDNQTTITVNSASPVTITVDQMATDYFVGIVNIGSGAVSIVAGSGVTLTGSDTIPAGTRGGVLILFTSATVAYAIGAGEISFNDLTSKPTTIEGYLITNGIRVLNQVITTTGNVGTGDDILHSYTLAAGLLAANGESIIIESCGTFGASANTKRVRVKFGSTTILDTTALSETAATNWNLKAVIVRTSPTAQRAFCEFISSSATLRSFSQFSTPAEDITTAIVVSVNGEGTSNNDVTATYTKVKKEGYV